MNNWELCPKCKGNIKKISNLNEIIGVCDICNGKGIINSFTGLPPKSKIVDKDILNNLNEKIKYDSI